METVYRQGTSGYTSRKREFLPSDLSKPKAAVQKEAPSNQFPESGRNSFPEPETKGEVRPALSAMENKQTFQKVDLSLPQLQPQPQPQPITEMQPAKVGSVTCKIV